MKLLLSLMTVCLLSSCGGIPGIFSLGPGGTPPGAIYSNLTHPNVLTDSPGVIDIDYDPATMELLGWFESDSVSMNLTGRIPGYPSGDVLGVEDADYGTVLGEIIIENELDGLMNVTVDTQRAVVNLFFLRYSDKRTRLSGIGYRFRAGFDDGLRERKRVLREKMEQKELSELNGSDRISGDPAS